MVQQLKLIAIIPPEPVFTEVRSEQTYIASTWGPKHALRTPPHITIIPPMALSSSEVGFLYGLAEAIASASSPFTIKLKDFGAFKPRVLHIQPIIPKALHELYDIWRLSLVSRLPHVLDRYPDRPYQPHMTLAHKDVKPDQFDKMWEHYSGKKISVSWQAVSFCLLGHTDSGWEVEREYFFGV